MKNTSLKQKFDTSLELQKEFSSFEAYQAFSENEKNGNVGVFDVSKRLAIENPPQSFEDMKRAWEADENLRLEFNFTFKRYSAFCKNYKARN